jgi:putative transposase
MRQRTCQRSADVMPRRGRVGTAGIVYHVMNRANRRDVIFWNDLDFAAFERVLFQAKSRFEMPLFDFVIIGGPIS